jgi:hypothetical protein
VRSHYSCAQSGGQLSVPQVMLSVTFSGQRSREYSKLNKECNRYFKYISVPQKHT